VFLDLKYRGIGLEILALLLLGLIAMLAIVPPIIRGKLDDSPLSTTQSFQRSMQEMANSIESHDSTRRAPVRGEMKVVRTGGGRIAPIPHPHQRRTSAAVRRSRIILALTIFSSLWGIATLMSGRAWCLVIFAIMCALLVIYWALTIIVPGSSSRSRAERSLEEPSRPPKSQAL
jgi:hypothetical protein